MKEKRYTTETKIRILREAQSRDKTIQDVCRERQLSEQSFHRWKRELGMLEINQAKQLKGAPTGEHPAQADAGRRDAG